MNNDRNASFIHISVNDEFDFINSFYEGRAFVRNKPKCGYINKEGVMTIPLEYDWEYNEKPVAPFFSEGLAALFKNGKLGFVDATGAVTVDFKYDYANTFHEGLAGVMKDGKWGYTNTKGELTVPYEYNSVYDFNDGIAPVIKNGKLGYIDKSGETVIPFEYDFEQGFIPAGFSEGLAPVRLNGKNGYVDKTGKAVIPFGLEYDDIHGFREGLAAVMTGKKIAVATRNNESTEDFIERYENEVRQNQKWGCIDKSGNLVIPVEYESILVNNEVIVAQKDGKQYFFDKMGNALFSTAFDRLGNFHEGLALAKTGGKYYYIDDAGSIKIQLESDINYAGNFHDGYAIAGQGNMYGFIDKIGAIVVPMEYTSVQTFREGVSIVQKNNKWGILKIDT